MIIVEYQNSIDVDEFDDYVTSTWTDDDSLFSSLL